MTEIMEQKEMPIQEYHRMVKQVADLAVNYANTDMNYYKMRDTFNELAERSGANKGFNQDATIERRKLLVKSVCIHCLPKLSIEATQWIEEQLNDIAEDYSTRRGMHR